MRLIRLRDHRTAAGRSPAPAIPAGGHGGLFVLQKWASPHCRAERFDLRLEIGGVLAVWVIPGGPSLRPGEPRLAIQGEDWPLGCIDFEGAAPPDQYGGGAVRVWDGGRWHTQSNPGRALQAGRLLFALEGRRLKGGWVLQRLASEPAGRSWRLTRCWDRHCARVENAFLHREQAPGSVHGQAPD